MVPVLVGRVPDSAHAAARAFTLRATKDLPGDITFAANTLLTCGGSCPTVQQGTGINNNYAMVFVDADTDVSTPNSSRAFLNIPAGSVVSFAGLYWGAISASANRNRIKFKAPGDTAYTQLTASTLDEVGSPYQGFVDVTTRVAATGRGDYWVGDIQAQTGSNTYAGWSLVVMFSAPGEKTRNCTVFDGINTVTGTVSPTITVSGFRTPPVGQVNTKLGVIAYEGDRGSTGDALRLNNVIMTDGANPANDFFNSSISMSGANVRLTKNPDYLNQLGFDADVIDVANPSNSVVTNGATSAQIRLSSTGDVYYPGVVTFCTDLYAPQIVSTKTGVDTTPATPLLPGDEIEYRIDVRNTGQDPAISTVITDPIPTWTNFVPGSLKVLTGPNSTPQTKTDAIDADQAEFSDGRVTFRIGTNANGTTGGEIPTQVLTAPAFTSVSFRVTVASNAPDSVPITNSASIDYAGFTLRAASVAASTAVATTISNIADLSITKTDGQTNATPGEPISYTMTVANASATVGVIGARVVDAVPVALLDPTWTCNAVGPSTCAAASGSGPLNTTVDLAPNGSATLTLSGRIDPAAVGSLVNTATITSPGGSTDPVPASNIASDTTTLTPRGDLRVTKSNAVSSVTPGGSTVWTIVASNSGPSTVTGATVSDTFAASIRSATWTCAASLGGSCPASGSGSIAAAVTLPPAGTATFTVTATLDPTATGSLANTATISAPVGFTDVVAANDADTDTDSLVASVDLRASKSHTPNPLVPGQPAQWVIRVDNDGPSIAPSASVTDTLPVGLRATAVASDTWTCSITAPGVAVACSATNLAPGASTITVTTETDPSITSSVLNSATVTSPSDSDLSNNTGSATATVLPNANLTILKSHVPGSFVAGASGTWYIQVANRGPSTARNLVLSDAVPAGFNVTSLTGPIGWSCNGVDECTTSSMLPDTTATFELTGTVSPTFTAGSMGNSATIATSTPDDPSDNTANDTVTVIGGVDLGVAKSRVGALVAGAPVAYTVVVTNDGPATATNATVTDNLPPEILSPSWTCVATGGGTCPAGPTAGNIAANVTLPAGARATFTISGTASPTASGAVVNTASVAAPVGMTDLNVSNNESSDSTNAVSRTALSITKGNDAVSVVPGTTTRYTIVVRNSGPSIATGATVTDALPTYVLSQTWTCTAVSGSCPSNGTGAIATPITLSPGGMATFEVDANIDPTAPAGGNLVNRAQVGVPVGSTDPDLDDNIAVDTDVLAPVADLSVTKTDNADSAIPGEAHSYTIIVRNAGPSTARAVSIVDAMPTSLMSPTWTCVTATNATCQALSGSGPLSTTADLAPGGQIIYRVDATIDATARGSLENRVDVRMPSDTLDPAPLDLSAVDRTELTPRADVKIQKTTSTNPAIPGAPIEYIVTVTNSGPSAVIGATVNDAIPMGIDSFSWTCAATGAAACGSPTGTGALASTVDLGPNSSVVFTISGSTSPWATGTVTNIATVGLPVDVVDLTPGSNEARVVSVLTPSTDVRVLKTSPSLPAGGLAGAEMTWTVTVNNSGTSAAPGTSVTDVVPIAVLNPTWTCIAGPGSTCAVPSGVGSVATTVDLAASSGIATFTITGTIDPWTTQTNLANTATIRVAPGITDAPGPDEASVDVPISRAADLSIAKTSTPSIAIPGTVHTWTVRVTNTGPSAVSGATVTDALPPSIADASWSCSASVGSACVVGGGTGDITTTVDLASGGVATFTVVGMIDRWLGADGPIDLVNTALVRAPIGVVDAPGNNSATETDAVTPRTDVIVSKTNATSEIVPGASTSYTISIKNAGPSAVRALTISDPLASPFLSASAVWTCQTVLGPSGSCSAATGTGALNITVDLEPLDIATVRVVVPVDPAATGSITNTATATVPAAVIDIDPANNLSSDVDLLTPRANLAIVKSNAVSELIPGTGVTYTLTVTNSGPSNAPAATVIDNLPSGLQSATWTCSPTGGPSFGTCTTPSGTGSISTTASLPVGATLTYLVTATVSASATGSLTNEATVTAGTGVTDPDLSNNRSEDGDILTPQADVRITKTDRSATQIPGRPTSYEITVTNNGPSDAPDVGVVDAIVTPLIDATWTCSPEPGASCDSGSGTGGINSTVDLPAGTSVTFTLTAGSSSAATGLATNTVQALMPSGITDPQPANNTATDENLLTPAAELRVTKIRSGAAAIPGEPVRYTITINNDGPSAATGVLIDDTLPAELVDTTWTCSPSSGASCARSSGVGSPYLQATLPVGSEVVLVVDADIAPGATGILSNTVDVTLPPTIVDPTPGTVPGTTSATDSTTLVPTADLSVAKSNGAASVIPGEVVRYTIAVRNDGPSSASGVSVDDPVASSLRSPTWTCSATGGSSCAVASGTGSIASSVDLAPGGVATYTLVATVSDTATGSLVNTASIGLPSGITDPDSADRRATDDDVLVPSADLVVTKTHSPTVVVPGQPVTYTVQVSNNGPSAAMGTSILDQLPPAVSNATWTCTASPGARCGATDGTGDIASSADLPARTTVTYLIVADVSPQATGVLSNLVHATLAASVVDPTPGAIPGRTTATDTTTLAPRAALSVTKSHAPTALVPGRIATYDIVVRNDGPSAAPGVGVSDVLPAGLLGATWTCSATSGSACADPSGSGSIATTADLAVGGEATLRINATIDPTFVGSLSNTARITAPSGVVDDPSNNSAVDTDAVVPTADLRVTKTHAPTPLVPGGTVTYVVTVTNDGPSGVSGARVLDPLPDNVDGVVWNCNPVARCGSGSTLSGDLDATVSLLPGQSVEIRGVGDIDPAATGSIVNTATALLPTGVTDPDGRNNSADDSPTVQPEADVVLTKELVSGEFIPGTSVTYRITATNRGPSHAPSVRVSDPLDPALLDASWNCAGAGGANCGQSDGLGSPDVFVNLPVNSVATILVSSRIDPSASGSLSNTASAALPSGITVLDPRTDTGVVTGRLTPRANLAIAKSHSPAVVVPGNLLTYTVTVSNGGPSAAAGLAVTDRLPTDLLGPIWTCIASPGSVCVDSLGSGDIVSSVDLQPQGFATFTVIATVDPATTGQLVNSAALAVPPGVTDTDPLDNFSVDRTVVEPVTDLSVTKTNNVTEVVPGSSTTYILTVRNAGPSAAVGAAVADLLPTALRNATWTCVAVRGTCDSSTGTGSVQSTVDLAPSGEASFVVTAEIDPAATGMITNRADVLPGVGATDPVTGNNNAVDADDLSPTANLSLTKSNGGNGVAPGTAITYVIMARNSGPSVATATRILDALPSELRNASWTCASSTGAPCTPSSGNGSLDATVDLNPGATATLTVTATVDSAATGQVINTASVAAGTGVRDPDPADNEASDTDALRPTVDLVVNKTREGDVVAGRPVTYLITVSNFGPSWARGARVLDPLPAGLSNAVWSCSGTGNATCARPSGTATIDASVTLPPAGQVVLRLTADVDPTFTGMLSNTARVLLPSTVIDLTPSNNEATDSTAVGVTADVAITKRLVDNESSTGSPARYEIVAVNNGPSAVTGASVVDRLPPAALSAAWTCGGRNGGSCPTSAGVASGELGSLVARARVDLPVGGSTVMGVTMTFAETSGPLVNEADAVLPTGAIDPVTANNTAVHRAMAIPVTPVVGPTSTVPVADSSSGPAPAPSPSSALAGEPAGETSTPPPTSSPPRSGAVGDDGRVRDKDDPAVAGVAGVDDRLRVAGERADRDLALTGADIGRLVAISLALALLGWGLVRAARRRGERR